MTKIDEFRQEAQALKDRCKEHGVSCVIILVDNSRNHSINRSIFDRHAPVMYPLLEQVKSAAIFGTVRRDPTKNTNGDDPAWIDASLKPDGMLVLSIRGRRIVSHQKVGNEHHLILADRPAETFGGARAAMARIVEVLREEGGDVNELCMRENSVFKLPL